MNLYRVSVEEQYRTGKVRADTFVYLVTARSAEEARSKGTSAYLRVSGRPDVRINTRATLLDGPILHARHATVRP